MSNLDREEKTMSEERNPTTENGPENGPENGATEETTAGTTPVATLPADADTPISPAANEEAGASADEGSVDPAPRAEAASDPVVAAEAEGDEAAEEEAAPAVAVAAEDTSSADAEEPTEVAETEPAPTPIPVATVAEPTVQATGPAPTQTAGPKEYTPEYEVGGRSRRIHIEVRLDEVNYKNVALLGRFLDPRGRILSRRKTRVSAKAQRRVVNAIKLARHVALLPYTAEQTRIVRRRR
jgi:small subunit ribosomal protein S18